MCGMRFNFRALVYLFSSAVIIVFNVRGYVITLSEHQSFFFFFYRLTVNSDICRVHSPTNALLLI